MSRVSVRGLAVASASTVTAVGAVVGTLGQQSAMEPVELTAADVTLLADVPDGDQFQAQSASLTQQAELQYSAAGEVARKTAEEAARKQAAKDAKAKKKAAEKAARKAAKEARSAATLELHFSIKGSYTIAEVQSMARQMVPADQFRCFSNIVDHESDWNYRAVNASSQAYGLLQALPGSKMASAGADWRSNPATQIEWGLGYMNDRYDSPCGAWAFWQANHWY